MRAVAKRIKAERERQGLSIADLAKILSVSEKDVLDLENGEMQLTMRDIDLFAIALEVSADRLKFGDDWQPNLGAQSKFENPRYNHSNVATNTAATMTTIIIIKATEIRIYSCKLIEWNRLRIPVGLVRLRS